MMSEPFLVPVPDAQEFLGGISRSTLNKLIGEKALTVVKVGRRTFITRSSIVDYIERQTT